MSWSTADLKVGDQVFFKAMVRHAWDGGVTVKSVGRKWVALSNGTRVEKGKVDCDGRGYVSPGRLYASQETYLTWLGRQQRYRGIMSRIERTYQVPGYMSDQDLTDLERIFRLDVQGS